MPAVVTLLSPQSIVAEYSLAVALASGSVMVATAPLMDTPSVAATGVPVALMAGSVAVFWFVRYSLPRSAD